MTLSPEKDFLSDLTTPQQNKLSEVLKRIKKIDEEIGTVNAQLKLLKGERSKLEHWACEEMQTQNFDGIRSAGRSWRVQEELRLSVSKDRRDAVLKAAEEVGIKDEITTVSTATLKAWLQEKAAAGGTDASGGYSNGTPFEGLVGEFVESKLRHTTVG